MVVKGNIALRGRKVLKSFLKHQDQARCEELALTVKPETLPEES